MDEARRALVFAGDIPQGGQARLMRGHPQRLIDGAAAAVQAALGQGQVSQDQPMLMLSVSCVGRRLVLGGNTEEELESIAARLPPGSGHVGFYAYGEISPAADRETRLHNQTLTVTVMVEDETAT